MVKNTWFPPPSWWAGALLGSTAYHFGYDMLFESKPDGVFLFLVFFLIGAIVSYICGEICEHCFGTRSDDFNLKA